MMNWRLFYMADVHVRGPSIAVGQQEADVVVRVIE